MGRRKTMKTVHEVLEENASVDPSDPAFKEVVAGGARTQVVQEERRKREKEPTIKISFELPISINNAIEDILSKRVIKISKSKWMAQAFLQKLKIKDIA